MMKRNLNVLSACVCISAIDLPWYFSVVLSVQVSRPLVKVNSSLENDYCPTSGSLMI